jgi:hypothetical protein
MDVDCAFGVCAFMTAPECIEGPRLVSKDFNRAAMWRVNMPPWLVYRMRRAIRRWRRIGARQRVASWSRRVYHPDDRVIL